MWDKAGWLKSGLLFVVIGLALAVGSSTVSAQGVSVGVAIPAPCVAYVGPVGFYNSDCGYWTGSVWDPGWYAVGHGGYGHGHWNHSDHLRGGHAHARTHGHK
jgi:hypothetical protein